MKYTKRNIATNHARRFIEPGPVLLISSQHKGVNNIMTCGWHIVIETSPAIVACYLWDQDDSREMIKRSKECVINIPEVHLARTVVKIGNAHQSELETDKFTLHKLTPKKATHVKAPLIEECHTNLECKLVDSIPKYSLFFFEVLKIHSAQRPKNPRTIHYRGKGNFMIAGRQMNLAKLFRAGALAE